MQKTPEQWLWIPGSSITRGPGMTGYNHTEAVIQPGGSVRDDEVIKAADDHGIAMAFTGTRHFRH